MNTHFDGAMTIGAFCVWASVGRTRTYEEIKQRRLRAKKLGGKTLISRQSAAEWLANLPDLHTAA
jgi:hypothetical protein